MHCRQRAQLSLAYRWINANGLLHWSAPLHVQRGESRIRSLYGRRISALQIGWWLRDRARQIRVKPMRVQTGWLRNALRRHARNRNRLCSRRWRAAPRHHTGRRSLPS